MSLYGKGSISYQPVVEEISRKFVPRKVTCSEKNPNKANIHFTPLPQGWMGGSVRKANRAGYGEVKTNTLVIRTAPYVASTSADAVKARQAFAVIAPAISEIEKDLTQIVSVQNLWKAAKEDLSKSINGIHARGYTKRGWMFAVQMAGYLEDPQYQPEHFPVAFDN